ncbi:MAG TPA: 2OG-Fe(II) oxygenase [Tardiphaga sp.]
MRSLDLDIAADHPALKPGDCRWQASAEQFHDDILFIHNGLPHLQQLVTIAEARPEIFEKSLIVDSNAHAYEDSDHRSNSHFGLSAGQLPDELSVYHAVCKAAGSTFLEAYRQMINPFANAARSRGYNLLRYEPGEFFDTHVDVVRGHPTFVGRQISVVAFCNQGFEGGELDFPRQRVKIKAEAGAVVLFPSAYTHPHASLPVREGTKYSVVSWYY